MISGAQTDKVHCEFLGATPPTQSTISIYNAHEELGLARKKLTYQLQDFVSGVNRVVAIINRPDNRN